MASSFDFLTLHLYLDDVELLDIDLASFFIAPNISQWRWQCARPFLHETLHFWQFLDARYLLCLVDDEWDRIRYFEKKQAILPPSPRVKGFHTMDPDVGFSTIQLMESWTRFWEIQIQDPSTLLEQESIELASLDPNVAELLHSAGLNSYKSPWHAIELAMMLGINNAVYGTPFRWMLDQVFEASGIPRFDPDRFEPNSSGPSYLCCVAFPTIVHAAFQHPDPVSAFKSAVHAICDQSLHLATAWGMGAQYMELDWFRYHEQFARFVPHVDMASGAPDECHRAIIPPEDAIAHAIRVSVQAMEDSGIDEPALTDACEVLARVHRPAVFAFMGFRPFRIALAHVAPPPIVHFRDGGQVLSGFRMTDEQTERMQKALSDAMAARGRVQRFRGAEKAAALNLPLNTFDLSDQ